MRGWKPKDVEIDDYAEENLNNYFKQVRKVLENSKIPQSRQKSVLEDLKELLQEYIEEKRIKSITYVVSLKLLELLGPPAEFAELAEEDSPPEIKTFETKSSKIVERKTSPLDTKEGIKPPKVKTTTLMDSKDPISPDQKILKPEEKEEIIYQVDSVSYRHVKKTTWKPGVKHILFLGLVLPFCFEMIINGLTTNFNHNILFWEDPAIPVWSTGLFTFCFISAIGTYYVFSRKKANLSDFFLSGVLYILFGLSQLSFLVVELVRYYPVIDLSNTVSDFSFWALIFVFVLLIFYKVFWSNRRMQMLVTNLSPESQLRLKVHTPLLFLGCSLLLFIQVLGTGLLNYPYESTTRMIAIIWSTILLLIALECLFIGFICVEPTLRSLFHDISDMFSNLKAYLQEYFDVRETFLKEYFGSEVQKSTPLEPNEKTKSSIAPSLSNGRVQCSICDHSLDLNWKFCPHCGFRNVPRVKKTYQERHGWLESVRRHSLFLALLSPVIIAIYCFAAILAALLNATYTTVTWSTFAYRWNYAENY
ncbi:MAG: hypothetical protein ACFFDI_19685, partial [Promethearchaeota archaeon]